MSWFRDLFGEVGEAVGAITGAAVGTIAGGVTVLGTGTVRMLQGQSFEEATHDVGDVFVSVVTTCAEGGGSVGKSVGQFAPEIGGAIAVIVTVDQLRQRSEENDVEGLSSHGPHLLDSARVGASLGAAAANLIDRS